MDPNSDTQDVVETTATENTSVESQETNSPETDTQEPDTAEQSENDEAKKEPEKPKRNRAQERIEQLARENAELRRFKAESEAKQNAPKANEKPTKPRIEDFETYEEYLKEHDAYEEKLDEWRISEAERRIQEKQSKVSKETEQVQREAEYEAVIAELAEEGIDIDHYAKKAEQLPALPIQLFELGLPTKDTLLLAKDLLDDEATYLELSQMSPAQAILKIGQYIGTKSTKSAPPVSKAPPPIKPVQANASVKRDAEKLSDNEFLKSRGL
ncbi:hypothetical protein RGN35_002114 [Acinetobacter baumannii]|uniref:hypothetical protein n=1 Tax=Acinetobacter baumannii TaxID=470 RepID=UPI0010540F92|nr:hypothetical protein [Acinetobacter baumannii]EKU6300188.1 hypothetical protein [Acinetobacter baumannii]EKV6414988.1 hypothetical protein [Acinetobacter baumannii]EKX0985328.1 hypothetical protein [Acinetobacter baumannii]EKX1497288.1 hypothetical protein [Acinetobacter baumannii]ELA8525397.1 hypothetical protein [Acinetobacter baumannii]